MPSHIAREMLADGRAEEPEKAEIMPLVVPVERPAKKRRS